MTLYTVAIDSSANLLAACVPDGDNAGLAKELAEYRATSSPGHVEKIDIISGVTLTDTLPDECEEIVWQGHSGGWLTDADGVTYEYGVKL